MRGAVGPLLIVLLAFATAVSAADQTGEPFAAGVAAFNAQDYERALTLFQAALDAGVEGPAVHYNIAVASYKLGRYRRAEAEFVLIADRYPAMRGLAAVLRNRTAGLPSTTSDSSPRNSATRKPRSVTFEAPRARARTQRSARWPSNVSSPSAVRNPFGMARSTLVWGTTTTSGSYRATCWRRTGCPRPATRPRSRR